MDHPAKYLKYPRHTVLLCNLHSLGIYAIGLYILSRFYLWLFLPWLSYILFLEIRLLKTCSNCFYFGKVCAFGKGRLSGFIFRKGNPSGFNNRCITWENMIPETLVTLLPLVAGIYILLTDFNWLVLSLLFILLFLSTYGNALIRGKMACLHCKQGEIGCPALKLFNPSAT